MNKYQEIIEDRPDGQTIKRLVSSDEFENPLGFSNCFEVIEVDPVRGCRTWLIDNCHVLNTNGAMAYVVFNREERQFDVYFGVDRFKKCKSSFKIFDEAVDFAKAKIKNYVLKE